MTYTGKRIRTKVEDMNDVGRDANGEFEMVEVVIPVGHTATVGQPAEGIYPIYWDKLDGKDMGWTVWTEEELGKNAEVIQ